MASSPHRKRRRSGRLTFESLEPRVVLDVQWGALLTDGSIAPAVSDGTAPASEVSGEERPLACFGSAEELKQFLIQEAEKRYADLFGRETWQFWPVLVLDARTSADGGVNADLGYSTTNLQVAGVDEGDLVKTDGRYLYIGRGAEVTIVDAQSAAEMQIVSRLSSEGSAAALYLSNDRLTVVSQYAADWPEPTPGIASEIGYLRRAGESKFQVTVYDVSEPGVPQLISRLDVEGSYVDSRMIDETVYLVSNHSFHLPAPQILPADPAVDAQDPRSELGLAAWSHGPATDVLPWIEADADGSRWVYETREQYWKRIGDQVLELALPDYTLGDAAGNWTAAGLLTAAEATYQPLGGRDDQLVTITALDTRGAAPSIVASSSAPIGGTSTVYVSPQNLYLATADGAADGAADRSSSRIYKFALRPEESRIPLLARGRVAGRVLDSFSLDEQGSYLRIVTQDGWRAEAASSLSVLEQAGEELVSVGRIEDLAPGEQLYGVRFLGDRAFVVTFGPDGGAWIDPLFTVDLSDPATPRVAGELKIPGFANYLQMIDGRFLLGLGRNANAANGSQLEPQLSLFDVSDLADPHLTDRVSFGDASSWSEAFFNHHAISYFPDQQILAVPLDTWTPAAAWSEAGSPLLTGLWDRAAWPLPLWQSQVWVFCIDTAREQPRIGVLGTIDHAGSILRSLRIGEQLFSISADTVQAHDIFDPGVKLGEVYFGKRAADDWFFFDVDGNDYLTPRDIVAVINRVNAGEGPAGATPGDAALPVRPLASWVDWQALHDWLHEGAWQEPLQTLQLTPERMLDIVHGLLATVDADGLDDTLQGFGSADRAVWRKAIGPLLEAIRDHVSVDQLLDLADQLQANFDALDLAAVMPGLAPQIDVSSADEIFRDRFLARLSDPLFLLDLLDS